MTLPSLTVRQYGLNEDNPYYSAQVIAAPHDWFTPEGFLVGFLHYMDDRSDDVASPPVVCLYDKSMVQRNGKFLNARSPSDVHTRLLMATYTRLPKGGGTVRQPLNPEGAVADITRDTILVYEHHPDRLSLRYELFTTTQGEDHWVVTETMGWIMPSLPSDFFPKNRITIYETIVKHFVQLLSDSFPDALPQEPACVLEDGQRKAAANALLIKRFPETYLRWKAPSWLFKSETFNWAQFEQSPIRPFEADLYGRCVRKELLDIDIPQIVEILRQIWREEQLTLT